MVNMIFLVKKYISETIHDSNIIKKYFVEQKNEDWKVYIFSKAHTKNISIKSHTLVSIEALNLAASCREDRKVIKILLYIITLFKLATNFESRKEAKKTFCFIANCLAL